MGLGLIMVETDEAGGWGRYRDALVESFRIAPPGDWTIPFVPWCGDEYWTAKPRLLFVGKGVGIHNDPDAELWRTPLSHWQKTLNPNPIEITDNYVRGSVSTLTAARAEFWIPPLLITSAFIPSTTSSRAIPEFFAWSNLFKFSHSQIAGRKELPSGHELTCCCSGSATQAKTSSPIRGQQTSDQCLIHTSLEWLQQEIEILRPDYVFLGIGGDLYRRFANALELSSKTATSLPMRLNDGDLKKLSRVGTPPRAAWITYHFSSWGKSCGHGGLLHEMRCGWNQPSE